MEPWFMWRGVILLLVKAHLNVLGELNSQILNKIRVNIAIYAITSHLQIPACYMCSVKIEMFWNKEDAPVNILKHKSIELKLCRCLCFPWSVMGYCLQSLALFVQWHCTLHTLAPYSSSTQLWHILYSKEG